MGCCKLAPKHTYRWGGIGITCNHPENLERAGHYLLGCVQKQMPKSLTQLTIFISGPSDTDAEKSALRRVIEELNRRLEKTHSL